MVLDVSTVLTWILFVALFPIAFFWLRRAWRIVFKRDFSEVALKRGMPPANPAKFAPFTAVINFVCGIIIVMVIYGVLVLQLEYETWSSTAGVTIWSKFLLDFMLSRHAHPIAWGRKKKAADESASGSGK
ncbi:hypothetical protein ACFQ4M_16395 [Thauera mechernichensis]|uniref:Uncharacterized protein n=1 Tax=Thauera mechernichensis TaxID=82788 RepID=A0ABW3WGH1_9RHOO|nr:MULTISPECIES: hypothetical protein [Thauera]ENO81646.1 hypothetical protein B447_07152 [Thauera sp. 27]MDG3063164.1 hypothetical protein [Thauera mechernichensis]HNS93010.1 hypothetical protein [Thauera sp.]